MITEFQTKWRENPGEEMGTFSWEQLRIDFVVSALGPELGRGISK